MAQHVLCEVDGFHAQHRYEDLAMIREVIDAVAPRLIVELGTGTGGLARFFARTAGTRVVTIDLPSTAPRSLDDTIALTQGLANLEYWSVDLLPGAEGIDPDVAALLAGESRALLYCDDGHKERELVRYGPCLALGATLGTHDYGTEVDPASIEPILATLGFVPYRHEDFAALAHPEYYPVSLTRFWKRVTA